MDTIAPDGDHWWFSGHSLEIVGWLLDHTQPSFEEIDAEVTPFKKRIDD